MATADEIMKIAEEGKKIALESKNLFGLETDYSEQIDSKVQEYLSGKKPRLLVCGVYSAGKSTLINVLNRKEVAEVGAQPKTDKITEYDSGDFIIIDSPGVDAPIEHEIITDQYVQKSNALMFVVSGKNTESEANYRKIKEWMQYEKPLMIVLNDKSGEMQFDSEANIFCRKKIEENMRRVGCSLKSGYDVITVDAKVAWEGIESGNRETEELLYHKSNLPQLESMIAKKMHDASALYMAPIGELVRVFDGLENELSMLAYGYDDDTILDNLKNLEKEYAAISKSVNQSIMSACEEGKQTILSVCMSGADQETIDTTCNQVMEQIGTKVDQNFTKQVERLSDVISSSLGEFGVSMEKDGKINIKGIEIDPSRLEEITDSDHPELICAINGAEIGYQIGVFLGTKLTESVCATASTLFAGSLGGLAGGALTSLAIPTLTSVISTAAPAIASGAIGAGAGAASGAAWGTFAGPLGALVGAGVGLFVGRFIADKKREKMAEKLELENAERQRAADEYYKRLDAELSTKMYEISSDFTKVSSSMIEKSLSDMRELLHLQLAQGKEMNERVLAARNQIAELKQRLSLIANSL